jgi:hypothetical protein
MTKMNKYLKNYLEKKAKYKIAYDVEIDQWVLYKKFPGILWGYDWYGLLRGTKAQCKQRYENIGQNEPEYFL